MADYRFETTWRLPADLTGAWNVLSEAEQWPTWWPSVRRVERLTPGASNGLGRRPRFHFGTRLPYTLSFEAELVEVAEPRRLVASADGELSGTWTCELEQVDGGVVVRHVWAVSTTRAWMNLLAPVARPAFAWNHASLMCEGGRGFAGRLGTVVEIGRT
jgi:uncharacterized protein YndB with AHSA1/START domain